MTPISDEDLLKEVKTALDIGGTYHDSKLKLYITEAKEFLLDAGVKPAIVNSKYAIGVITRGVSDLWNYGSGNTQLSTYFMQRATQLAYKEVEDNELTE